MGRKSKVRQLPRELRDELERLLDDDRLTLEEITEHMRRLGADLSGSSVWRFQQKHQKLRDRLASVREAATMLAGDLEDVADGKQTRLISEMIQGLLFRYSENAVNADTDPETAKDIKELARAFKDWASAQKISTDLHLKLRKELAAKLDGALKQAEAAGEKGLSADRLAELRREFLGVREASA